MPMDIINSSWISLGHKPASLTSILFRSCIHPLTRTDSKLPENFEMRFFLSFFTIPFFRFEFITEHSEREIFGHQFDECCCTPHRIFFFFWSRIQTDTRTPFFPTNNFVCVCVCLGANWNLVHQWRSSMMIIVSRLIFFLLFSSLHSFHNFKLTV